MEGSKKMKVLKQNRRSEEFIPEKIVASIVKAGAPVEIAREIAKHAEEKFSSVPEVRSEEIREFTLSELKERHSEAYENWVSYERLVKKKFE